jgi:protein SCO1/2
VPRLTRLGAAAVTTVAAVALAGCGSSSSGGTYQGDPPAIPAYPLPSVPLTSTTGASVTLSQSAPGTATLLYFGYTHCPDVCPTTMADLATALRAVPVAVQKKTQVVFVTSDPARDTAPVIDEWLSQFHFPVKTVGLRGSVADVDAAGKQVGVILEPPTTLPDGTIDVEHGALLTGYDPKGQNRVEWLVEQDDAAALTHELTHDLPLLADNT